MFGASMFGSSASHLVDLNRHTPVRANQYNQEESEKLYRAVCDNRLADAQAALSAHANPNFCVDSLPLLAYATKSLPMANLLLKNGAHANFIDALGGNLFHQLAVSRENDALMPLLKQHGANINRRNKRGETPLWLMASCDRENKSRVKMLLELGAEFNMETFDDHVPKTEKAFVSFKEYVADCLIECVNENIKKLADALGKEAVKPSIEMLNGLTKPMASAFFKTARSHARQYLVWAISRSIEALNESLVLKKAKIDLAKVIKNLNLLQGFGSVGFIKKTAKVTLEHCLLDIDAKREQLQADFLFALIKWDEEKISKDLITNIDVNYVSKDGRTPLWIAVRYGSNSSFDLLVRNGAVIQPLGKTKAEVGQRKEIFTALSASIQEHLTASFLHCITNDPLDYESIGLVNTMMRLLNDRSFRAETAEIRDDLSKNIFKIISDAMAHFPAKAPNRVNAGQVLQTFDWLLMVSQGQMLSWSVWVSDDVTRLLAQFRQNIQTEIKVQSELLLKAQTKAEMEDALAAGANVNYQDEYGYTALMRAASAGNKDFIPLLVQHHANLDLIGEHGFTAIQLADHCRFVDVVEMLRGFGAKPVTLFGSLVHSASGAMALDETNIAFFNAISANDVASVERLIHEDVTCVNRPNLFGVTPIMAAAYVANQRMLKLLIVNGGMIDWPLFNDTSELTKQPLGAYAKKCIAEVLLALIEAEIHRLFLCDNLVSLKEIIAVINQYTEYLKPDEFKEHRDGVRKAFIKAMKEAEVLHLKHLILMRDKIDGIQIIQRTPKDKKDKTAMVELNVLVDELNKTKKIKKALVDLGVLVDSSPKTINHYDFRLSFTRDLRNLLSFPEVKDTDGLIVNINDNMLKISRRAGSSFSALRAHIRKQLVIWFKETPASLEEGQHTLSVLDKVLTRLDILQGKGSVQGKKSAMYELRLVRHALNENVNALMRASEPVPTVFDAFSALTSGNPDKVKYAIEVMRADVNVKNAKGVTPLAFLARYYDFETIKLLIKSDADIDWVGMACVNVSGDHLVLICKILCEVIKDDFNVLIQDTHETVVPILIARLNKKMRYLNVDRAGYQADVDACLVAMGKKEKAPAIPMVNYAEFNAHLVDSLKDVLLAQRMALKKMQDEGYLSRTYACLKTVFKELDVFKRDDVDELKEIMKNFILHLKERLEPFYEANHTRFYKMTPEQQKAQNPQYDSKKSVDDPKNAAASGVQESDKHTNMFGGL